VALILIVDDEPAMRQVLARWIRAAGHEIVEAGSADAALDMMEKAPATVVFCDVQMPGRDGLWLTKELRMRYPQTAVVLATAVTTVAPRISMQEGVLAYLVKPFEPRTITEALVAALAWHVGAGELRQTAPAEDRLEQWLDSLEQR